MSLPAPRGPKGEPGLAAQITALKIDRQRYRAVPFYSDGKPGPAIELRDLFQHFLNETRDDQNAKRSVIRNGHGMAVPIDSHVVPTISDRWAIPIGPGSFRLAAMRAMRQSLSVK
jgi:hypothetical protein